MKRFHLYLLSFFSTMWSMNVMAFEVDGINYEVLSESEKTAYVTRQPVDFEGDMQISSQVNYEGGSMVSAKHMVSGIVYKKQYIIH